MHRCAFSCPSWSVVCPSWPLASLPPYSSYSSCCLFSMAIFQHSTQNANCARLPSLPFNSCLRRLSWTTSCKQRSKSPLLPNPMLLLFLPSIAFAPHFASTGRSRRCPHVCQRRGAQSSTCHSLPSHLSSLLHPSAVMGFRIFSDAALLKQDLSAQFRAQVLGFFWI